MWREQNGSGQGSNNKEISKYKEDYKKYDIDDTDNYVEFLDDNEELMELAYIFNLVDFEYMEGGFLKGKNYFQLKDLLKMYGYKKKNTLEIMLQMIRVYCYEANRHK